MAQKNTNEGRITGAASIVGAATVVSRLLGYLRDASIAYVFGASFYADAFFMAFRIANLLRRLVGEGALTSSFIPIFTDELNKRGRVAVAGLVASIFTLFAIILIALTGLGMIFSRELVWLLSPGFASDPLKFNLTVDLTRMMFPYMFFVGLMAIAMGVLNSMRHFASPAISPVFFNIAIIFSIFVVAPLLNTPVYALAIGVLAGGFLQFAVQVPFLKKYGFTPRLSLRMEDPAIKKILLLMGPAAFGVGVYQLNIFVTLWFSSRLAEGSVSYLYYSGRLMELPLGVFSVAVTTAALPSLSEHVAKKDWAGFRESFSFAMRIVNFVTIPATVGLFVLSYPIIDVLFRRGEFGYEDTMGTALALYYYAIGLVPVAASRILMSVFYSTKDTVTPVWVAFVSFVFNVVFCFLLIGPLRHAGLALATSIAGLINAILLFMLLRKRFNDIGARFMLMSALKSCIASIVMGAIIYSIIYVSGFEHLSVVSKSVVIVICLAAGAISYLIMARVLKCPEIAFLKAILKRGA